MAIPALLSFAMPALAQFTLKTTHFVVYSNSTDSKLPERCLRRLEKLRSALISLHGEAWAPTRPQQIWIPASAAEWFSTANREDEQGIYRSGPRKDWIVVNPKAEDLLQVLSHEYVHAVLGNALPSLPSWFEEGICEYYSTAEVNDKDERRRIVLGGPPGNRLKSLGNLRSVPELSSPLDPSQYAIAWAIVHRFARHPNWNAYLRRLPYVPDVWALSESMLGLSRRNVLEEGRYVTRTIDSALPSDRLEFTALSSAQVVELEAGYHAAVPTGRRPGKDAVNASRGEQLLLDGVRLADEGRSAEAISLLNRACALKPSNSPCWLAMALAHRDAGQSAEAHRAASQALDTAINGNERAAARTLLDSLR